MLVKSYRDLEVWRKSFDAGMAIFAVSKRFPREEIYSLTDQIRRSSRAVSANIAEAWEHTRYKPMFVSKLTRAAGEAAETQNWIDYAVGSDYLSAEEGAALHDGYDSIIRTLRSMIIHSEKWCPKTYRAEVHES